MPKEKKKRIREEIALLKRKYSKKELEILSNEILSKIEETDAFQNAATVALYHAIPGEVQTASFINKWYTKKQLYLPVIHGDILEMYLYTGPESVKPGVFGILEPKLNTERSNLNFSLIIVPGVAFDRHRNRMGRGKGYYDRLLHRTQAYKIGICYDFQLLDEVPFEPFDIPMDMIITESEVIR